MKETTTKSVLIRDRSSQRRSSLADSITVLSKQFYQSVLVENPNTYEVVSNSLISSIHFISDITAGDIAVAQRQDVGKIKIATEMMSIDDVDEAQSGFDSLISIAASDLPFKSVQRLKRYLPIILPDTREGLSILREISQKVSKKLGLDRNPSDLAQNLKSLYQILSLLESEFISNAVLDENFGSNIFARAVDQARIQLNYLFERESTEDIENLKMEIAQNKLTKLKDAKVKELIDGEEREFSQLDQELYKIILDENLQDRLTEGRQNQDQDIERRKSEVIEKIVKKRGIKKIAGLILSDENLLNIAVKISGLTREQILSLKNEEGLQTRIEIIERYLSTPKKKLTRLGITSFTNFEQVFEEEKQKLNQALELGDPLLFTAQLSVDEFDLLRKIIPNIFKRLATIDNRALFTLAKEALLKRTAAESTQEELINLLAEKIQKSLVRNISQEMIDGAIQELNIDLELLIKNPFSLFDLSGEILTIANQIAQTQLKQKTNSQQLLLNSEPTAVANASQFNLTNRSTPRELNAALQETFATNVKQELGPVSIRNDILSTEGPFQYFPEYRTSYPEIVQQALVSIYTEYNQSFTSLVRANQEWSTDYQYCLTGPGNTPVNYFVQIDMTGLSDNYLQTVARLDEIQVRDDLKGRIYEIENSIAMYQLLMKVFSRNGELSKWEIMFRQGLEDLRRLFGKPIALLAVTEGKYDLMKGSEFGKQPNVGLTNSEIRDLSGFDAFFGPTEFIKYLNQTGGRCDYLLYVRSSDPVAKLRNPKLAVEHPLLGNPELRRLIKANTVTLNIDNPSWPIDSPRRINDTKAYLMPMNMAYPLFSLRDLKSQNLKLFLQSSGLAANLIESGEIMVRAKPMTSSYGCYGHLRGSLNDDQFQKSLVQSIRKRGPYVVQPEMNNTTIVDKTTGSKYVFIDRDFFSFTNGAPRFMGGERTLMLNDSQEAVRGRIHGNETTITAEVY